MAKRRVNSTIIQKKKPFHLTEENQSRCKKRKNRLLNLILLALIAIAVLALPSCADNPPETDSSAGANGAYTVHGYALRINGTDAAYLRDEESARAVTELLCEKYRNELIEQGITVESVRLTVEIKIEESEFPENRAESAESAAERISLSDVTLSYNVTETVIEQIDFKTVKKNSSAYYEGTEKIQSNGENGEKRLTYSVDYLGSSETARSLVSDETVKEPKDKVVLVGTKKNTASTGSYAWPTKSVYITSDWGWRVINGTRGFHYGIDLRAAVGTAIYAADGGKVTFVGTSGNYGKLIKIQHDNGDVTYYAHLSAYSVKTGDRVYKGQLIAKSGATGRVTGPHLHFEIRKNGVQVDPEKYLPKR